MATFKGIWVIWYVDNSNFVNGYIEVLATLKRTIRKSDTINSAYKQRDKNNNKNRNRGLC